VRVLLLGDIVGRAACKAVCASLPALRLRLRIDLAIANAENAVDGQGLDPASYAELRGAGVDVVTSGNHIWQHREIMPLLDSEERLLRPANYPEGVPGHGTAVVAACGVDVAVVNLEGRRSLASLLCPFATARRGLDDLSARVRVAVGGFHAEGHDEKEALAFHLDGRVSAVVGTHTHVQTADERILPGGTGYLTDAGMCGSSVGVIGMNPALSVERYMTQMPIKMQVHEGPVTLCGALLELDPGTGRCREIRRVREP
jgi:2',3'-cyclic-nucleotide 2'-phosphodiesterase